MPSSVDSHRNQLTESARLLGIVLGLLICSSTWTCAHGSHNLQISDGGSTKSLGQPYNLTCSSDSNNTEIWWSKNGANITTDAAEAEGVHIHDVFTNKGKAAILEFKSLSLSHYDTYVCNSSDGSSRETFVSVDVQPYMDLTMSENTTLGADVVISCKVTGYPLHSSEIHWKFNDKHLHNSSFLSITNGISNMTQRESIIRIFNISDSNNGTYVCDYTDEVQPTAIFVRVYGPPLIMFDVIREVGKSEVFLNWTLNDRNSNLTDLVLTYNEAKVNGNRSTVLPNIADRYVLKNLSNNTMYKDFTITARNKYGEATNKKEGPVTTLREDPHFVPSLQLKGISPSSVTLGWTTPAMADFFHFYKVTMKGSDGKNETRIAHGDTFIAEGLNPRTQYSFQVQACSEYTQSCDERSNMQNATTMDGTSSEPLNVRCSVDPEALRLNCTWNTPSQPRGQITEYLITLDGVVQYVNHVGGISKDALPVQRKSVTVNKPMRIDFHNLSPNTNYTIGVCAITESKQCGAPGKTTFSTPVAPPSQDELNKVSWVTYKESGKILFRIALPPISQRNGTICCLRVVIVRLSKSQGLETLPPPAQMSERLTTYQQAHASLDSYAAYVAEVFDLNGLTAEWRKNKPLRILIGDGLSGPSDSIPSCGACSQDSIGISGSYRTSKNFPAGLALTNKNHRKRHAATSFIPETVGARDGPLDPESSYTGFIVATVAQKDSFPSFLTSASNYFSPLLPREEVVMDKESIDQWGILFIGLLSVVLLAVFVVLMCVMRWRRKEPGDQEYGFTDWVQQCWRGGGRSLLTSVRQPDRPPIAKEFLVAAYLERHENSDAGFHKEFEDLPDPDQFRGLTTEASDKNVAKNRYPDIRAYDHTRVKLSTADGGSDYINANKVIGYKERKHFICAQGPMDTTVNDWWRMVWEQRVHMVIMLTNLEEYSKQKCARYWPSEGSADYGSINVTHHSEKRFADYLLRTLKLKQAGAEGEASNEREIEQYHYLDWKDWSAPEYPMGIIRFIKRFNENYSMEKGPILVHCSAGVGRTGTLVALDSLLQQLNEEGQVAIFNTIWDMRKQRNYLVQSLKQYIFIYRALIEAALFGDTEIPVGKLKSQRDELCAIRDGKTTSSMEEEFERLKLVVEDKKPFLIGVSEENKHRNRHENIIPYDRNRVILSPIPGPNKETCTYINASFIEGYDSSEQYIIAQDPLEVTVGDFWRMIVEHNIRSVVMLSETGEDKCLRYWPEKDQETSHDFIRVKYMQSQSCPYYYRREFTVTKTKGDESCLVTQFQYNGWPIRESEVPESARGMVELVNTIFKHRESLDNDKSYGSTLVHCSSGTDRSCIFVALAILARQLKTESRIDVFSVVRKLRSQRLGLFQNFAQYEFLYKGLDTYADLHMANGNASH